MPKEIMGRGHSRFGRWFHGTFDDWMFRSLIGPAQTRNAVQGCDQEARDQWKRDLEARKRYSRERRERREHNRELHGSI
jgi:hypothetical protein